MGDGTVQELSIQHEVEKAIWTNIHQNCYHLAEEAPICQGQLRGQFGYNAHTPAEKQVLDGTYIGTDTTHSATLELCQVIGDLWKRVPKDLVHQIITCEAWQDLWRKKHEETSFSPSCLHFSHYIAGTQSDIISDMPTLKTSLALYHGIALIWLQSGLCVMLEK